MVVKLNTVKDVSDFASICSKVNGANIEVKQGRYIVDGKSILGIYSLNLMDPIEVFIDTEDEVVAANFHKMIGKWGTN